MVQGGSEPGANSQEALFIPDTTEISILLKEIQKRRQHMAIVIDEYGTTTGIVTLEDIMEEIFGEIWTRPMLTTGWKSCVTAR